MHELAIAESIVRIAGDHAAGRPVARIEVVVGHLRQVVPSALAFSFDLVAEGTAVEGAELAIVGVEPAGRCRACGTESRLGEFPLACGACRSLDVEVTAGHELYVDSLELEEDAPVVATA